jgi:uncharacterized protein YjlB
MQSVSPDIKISTQLIQENGKFPNNPDLPVIIYKNVFSDSAEKLADQLEKIFKKNHWTDAWRNGIYEYPHYHSTAHEVLGISQGYVVLELGGPDAFKFRLNKGDVVVLPAGVSHKNIECSKDFEVVGAYPKGQQYDLLTGKPGEKEQALKNISAVPLPETDPVLGKEGGISEKWTGSHG